MNSEMLILIWIMSGIISALIIIYFEDKRITIGSLLAGLTMGSIFGCFVVIFLIIILFIHYDIHNIVLFGKKEVEIFERDETYGEIITSIPILDLKSSATSSLNTIDDGENIISA